MDISRIEASLSLGKLVTGKQETVSRTCFKLFCVIQILFIVLLIIITTTGNFNGENNEGFVLLGANALVLVFLGLMFVTVKINKCNKDKVCLWLEDAVLLKASVKRMDIVSRDYQPYQVQVEFMFNGKKQRQDSKRGGFLTGFSKVFIKYTNQKEVQILYSPKYNQVLFLKS